MNIPDEGAMKLVDRAVWWLHDWGVPRKYVMRIAGLATAFGGSACYFMREGPLWAVMLTGIVALGVLYADEWRVKAFGVQIFNLGQYGARQSPISLLRFVCVLLSALTLFNKFPWNLDAFLWVPWLYLVQTYHPIDPPKRSLREAFAKRLPSFAGAS